MCLSFPAPTENRTAISNFQHLDVHGSMSGNDLIISRKDAMLALRLLRARPLPQACSVSKQGKNLPLALSIRHDRSRLWSWRKGGLMEIYHDTVKGAQMTLIATSSAIMTQAGADIGWKMDHPQGRVSETLLAAKPVVGRVLHWKVKVRVC